MSSQGLPHLATPLQMEGTEMKERGGEGKIGEETKGGEGTFPLPLLSTDSDIGPGAVLLSMTSEDGMST